MAWSTELFCSISFNRETFNSRYEVECKIEEVEKCLQLAKDSLFNLAIMTEPQKFCPEDLDPLSWVQCEFRENMELIEDYIVELSNLKLLLDNWDNCHNEEGLAIYPPDNIEWDTAYLCGDFVNSDKYPDANRTL